MKRNVTLFAVTAMSVVVFFGGCNPERTLQPTADNQKDAIVDSTSTGSLISNQYIVVFKSEGGIQNNSKKVTTLVNSIITEYAIPEKSIGVIFESALQGFSAKIDANTAGLLAKDPRVESIEQDRVISIEPIEIEADKTALNSVPTIQAQTPQPPWGVTRIGGSSSGIGKTVWIIDSGVDINSPYLNIDSRSINILDQKQNANDEDGHGKYVVIIIAGKKNDYNSVVGVAEGAKVVAVKVFSKGKGNFTTITAGVDYITSIGNAKTGDVVNISIGSNNPVPFVDPYTSYALEKSIKAAASKGIKIVIAAGQPKDFSNGQLAKNYIPSKVNGTNIYTVAAIDTDSKLAPWSNYGSDPCDFAAPGDGIDVGIRDSKGKPKLIRGTSFAAPHVAGILLLGQITNDGYVNKGGSRIPIAYRVGATTIDFNGKQPSNQTVNNGQSATFMSNPKNASVFQWQIANGTSWQNLKNGGVYNGVSTPILTISNSSGMNGYKYRINAKYNNHSSSTWTPSNPAILTVNSVPANQAPSIEWQKSFGGSGNDIATSVQSTSDGGYIVAGYTNSIDGNVTGNHGGEDCWVLKLNSNGSIQWEKTFGGSGVDRAQSIKQTSDGGYVMAGFTESNDGNVTGNHGQGDYWVVKLNSSGDILWQKSMGGSGNDGAGSIQQTNDGGYIVAGISASNNGDVTINHGNTDYWVVKLNSSGTIQWQKSLGGSSEEQEYNSVQQTNDGGYIVAGASSSSDGDVTGNHGGFDYWIVKLNSSGNIQWQNSLGGNGYDFASSIQQTSDGGYIVAGSSELNNGDITGNHGYTDYWVVKLNSSGTIQWQKSLGGSGYDGAFYIQQTSDGTFVVAGTVNSIDGDVTRNQGDSDSWIVKLTPSGTIIWQKSIGGSSFDAAYTLQQNNNGGYIVGGISGSNNGDVTGNHGGFDFWIVKLKFP
ncbi:MAG: S8 family serine peptidase [Ignavibacteria bacterium]|nr:S8 family serine peptidase [Ignavibacteria bacterium]